MRYFKTLNASHPYKVGGFIFEFEALYPIAGAWVGVLEVPEEEQAEILDTLPQASEITKDEYDALKKKVANEPHSFRPWLSKSQTTPPSKPLASPPPRAAVPAEKVELSSEEREIVESAVSIEDPLQAPTPKKGRRKGDG